MYLVNDSEASPTHALYNTEKQVQAYINKQIDEGGIDIYEYDSLLEQIEVYELKNKKLTRMIVDIKQTITLTMKKGK